MSRADSVLNDVNEGTLTYSKKEEHPVKTEKEAIALMGKIGGGPYVVDYKQAYDKTYVVNAYRLKA